MQNEAFLPFGPASRTAGSLMSWLAMMALAISVAAAAPEPSHTWEDRDHFPEAYSILTSDRVMFPDDVSDWPLKIDARHQLFVDDFIISKIEQLTRQFHQPIKHPANPLMPGGYMGVLHDEKQGRFRMWNVLDYHTSADGIRWSAPIPMFQDDFRHETKAQLRGFMYNPDLPEREGRYKAIVERRFSEEAKEPGGFYLYHSRDGLKWDLRPRWPVLQRTHNLMRPAEFRPQGTGSVREFRWDGTDHFQGNGVGDTSTFRYDTVLKRYIFDGKFGLYLPPQKIQELGLGMDGKPRLRLRTFSESEDLIHWSPPRFLMYPDRLDPTDRQMYAHVGFVYESMWLGTLQAMRFHATGWKQTDLHLTYSRDGRHWLRPREREPFIPLGGPDSWDADYSTPCYTAPVLVNGELFFYFGGSRNPERDKDPEKRWPIHIGLAKLRRDGFASLNAGATPGQIVTRPLTFAGKNLLVNADVADGGWVKAGVLSRNSQPVAGHELENAVPLTQNTTKGRMTWKAQEKLPSLEEDHLRIQFQLKNAKLYSFWIE